MTETARHACKVCTRTDLSLTANGRVRSHAANGKRPGPDNPNCLGGSDYPRTVDTDDFGQPVRECFDCDRVGCTGCTPSQVTVSGGPNPWRPPLPNHRHRYEYGDDENGHSGSFCVVCGDPEPETEPPLPEGDGFAHFYEDASGLNWRHSGQRSDCTRSECQPAISTFPSLEVQRQRLAEGQHPLTDEEAGFRQGPTPAQTREAVDALNSRSPQQRFDTAARMDETASRVLGLPQDPQYTDNSSQTEEDPWQSATHRPDSPRSTSPQSVTQTRSTPPDTPEAGPVPSSPPRSTASASTAGMTSSKGTSSVQTETVTHTPSASMTDPAVPEADVFDSAPAAKPEPKRDRWGRYMLPHPDTGKRQAWTRATTMAKSISDTFALNMWSQRMTAKGLALRPDLVALAGTLDVKADKDRLNSLVDQAKDAAGQKVAANLGTAVHSYTEHVDGGGSLESVPVLHRPEVAAYLAAMRDAGLTAVPHLIERITVVPEFGTAGTLDRVLQEADGSYVIGDVKGLALTERIPTPDGWTTMGDVAVGDTVFDAYGKPCTVTLKSSVKRIGTYVVRFDDGSSVVCDTEHIWWTASGFRPGEPTAKPISEVIETLRGRNGAHHRVPVAGALELPEVDLPIDPYLLGCWLGDGAVRGGTITKGRDLFEILESDGHALGVEQLDSRTDKCLTRTVIGLGAKLRSAGLTHNKHIPAAYLRASVFQRLRLLQGLMDTDGSWNKARKSAAFSTTDKALALQVEELMLSLGQRPYLSYFKRRGFDLMVDSWTVELTPVDLNPFRLPRKADQAAASVKQTTRSRRRVIVAVDQGPDVDTACIGVDSPTHTYLCGDRMIPTHNTGRRLEYGWPEIAIQLALYAHGVNTAGVYDMENERWEPDPLSRFDAPGAKVSEEYGIVMHLPIGEKTCTLYRVDLKQGWAAASLCASVRDWRKVRTLAEPYVVAEADGPTGAGGWTTPYDGHSPVAVRPPTWAERFASVSSRGEAAALYTEAVNSLGASSPELAGLVKLAQQQLASLEERAG